MRPGRFTRILKSTVFHCFIPLVAGMSGAAMAAPEGGLVIGGSAVIEQSGQKTTIRQSSNRGIIRWNKFDIDSDEHVEFQQPSRHSITVNRIADTKASKIDGRLSANGNIVLINPNGIHFGSGAQVDVGGLVASTSDLEDDTAFMNGGALRLTRPGNPEAKILNAGRITVAEAGLAGFIAPHIENEGVIEAQLGQVTLASGDISAIDLAGDGLIMIEVSDQVLNQQIKNKGLIKADGGRILMTAATGRAVLESLISNEGTLQAKTTPEGKGEIRITSARGGIQNTGVIDASGDTALDGGRIEIDGSFVSLGGSINADGAQGGDIVIRAGTLSLADRISARGLSGKGGSVDIQSQTSWEVSSSVIDTSGFLDGGIIRHIAENQIISSGTYLSAGHNGHGGRIDISGWSTKFLSARIEADGWLGGGVVRLGGEYQGGKDLPVDEMPNAYYLIMDRGTRIRAEAMGHNGKGGTVILWSDQETVALGEIFVKPGTLTGEGGFVEISSAQTPKFDATIQAGRDGRAGTVLLDPKNILISDFSFNSTAIILGYGYQGGRTNSNTNLDANDNFGFATALDGNRIAVGAYADDGFGNTLTNTGAVYLFSFADASFSGATLEGIIGSGYTGGKNVDITLANNDYFGYSVSLDGDRLAVGAYGGDGSANVAGDSGEVYLFSFADSVFSGAVLEATIGRNYTGGKNINVSTLTASDLFGSSVSLSGNALAVGAIGGDGSTNAVSAAGEVYLFSFTDAAFSGGILEATLGSGYTGGKNLNLTLDANDNFGVSLSLEGTQLAVGADRDDGFGNTLTDSGAVYLFSFADSAFATGALEATMGFSYTGGKNVNIADLGANDYFGSGVAIDNNRLAVGAYFDDGYLDVGATGGNFGAVRLYTISNDTFDSLTLESTIGYQYRDGAKNYDLFGLNLAGSDYFGKSLSLDGNRLIVGAYADDGLTNNNSSAGALYSFTFANSSFATANLEGIIGSGYIQGRNFNVPGLGEPDNAVGYAVSIDGTKLAVGNYLDDGFGDIRQSSGAVYLYSFSDDSFTGGVLQGIIGAGYTGGKNYNQDLRVGDGFGVAVSLDGNRLAVGAYLDDGFAATGGNTGAVYLYSFDDATFTGIDLESRIGFGYTGGKNLSPVGLGGSDSFGRAVSLDGTRLAVGSVNDDGVANALSNAGAVYLFSFADTAFNTPTLEGIIGQGYAGGKNIAHTGLDSGDAFGVSVALDGNRVAVGSYLDDGQGNAASNTGAVFLYTFTDSVFSGGTLAATIGRNYTGGNNLNNSTLSNNDYFGYSVALSGNNLFVGAILDDGSANAVSDAGGVFRYSFATSTFTGGALAGSIGARYTGANDYDLRGYTGASDAFGSSISVDGRNLVVGSYGDDGYGNNATDSGAVYLIRYSDLTYATPDLMGVIGAGYDPSYLEKSIHTVNVKDTDYYGYAVALDGTRMAVGAPQDDGLNDVGTNRGAVYLYSFSDTSFTGGVLQSIIGQGYTGGKNINLTLDNNDLFGSAVSLDGNRLAVGAYGDDGNANAITDAGAVYLFDFTDSVFSGGTLQARIGHNYTGGKNVARTLAASDYFGWSVSLDGNRLAIGAQRDDGSANNRTDSGAVFLYNFTDAAFSGGLLQSIIGFGYTGGKNINLATVDASDYFGSAVSLDGNRLAIGAPLDNGSGNAFNDTGAVYLYTFTDAAFTGGSLQSTIGAGYTGGKNMSVALETSDWFGSSVSLNGNALAVGAEQDDGYLNQATDSGAARVYTFTDSVFSGGALQSSIGYRYAGAKDIDLAPNWIADVSDRFSSVALDGTRLLIGGHRDTGLHVTNGGSVIMANFADNAFSGGTIAGLAGNGYSGNKGLSTDPNFYTTADSFGYAVSLNANRLAVTAINDDGQGNGINNAGAVYLYSIPDGDYDAITLQGIIGHGYTGGKNLDLSTYLDRSDAFGSSLSLDGNRLAVGAYLDDGLTNNVGNAGAVYLFSFTDSLFSGATLEARIGTGYTGGKNINLPVTGSDYLGWSVSLDGTRLAVGAQRDDGFANNRADAGAVYLFSFTDTLFSGGVLQSTIGYGYTGGKNFDLATLDNSDYFASAVSLDGNRLAVGSPNDDGNGNTGTNFGAAYLFTFGDSTFSSPTMTSTFGLGYTGTNDMNITSLFTGDFYGTSVGLDGTVLAVGAPSDDGLNLDVNGGNNGAIFLYTFNDLNFSGPLYDSAVGNGYTGGKNININLGAGFSNNLSLDSGVLVAGTSSGADITGNLGSTGRVYIFRDSLLPLSAGASFGNLAGNTIGITAASIAGLLSSGTNIILQASNDITIASPIFVNNGSGNGGTLTLQAGRSIIINSAIQTDNGNLNFYANENLAAGVINSQRDTGAATISMGTGGSIDAGSGSVVFRMDAGTGKTFSQVGDIVLRNITAGSITALSSTEIGNIVTNGVLTASGAGTAILLDAGANYINNYGAGALVTSGGRWLVYGDHDDYTTPNNLSPDFTYYSCVYAGACSAVIPGGGNGLLYQYKQDLITIVVNTARAYGDANPNNATLQSLYQYSGFDVGEDYTMLDSLPTASVAATALANANAGTTHAITLSGGLDDKYDYYLVGGLLTINKKDITASFNAPLSKTYGDVNPSVNTTNFTYTGLANAEGNGVITATPDFGTIDVTTGAGSYSVGATFTATNYNVTNSPTTTLTINKRNITAAWTGGLNRVYGDANPAVDTNNFTYTGFVNADTNAAVTASADYLGTTVLSNVGSYGVNGMFTSANYNITNTPSTTLTIGKRDITAAVNNQSRAYGDANPALTWADVVWTNLANAQDGSVIDALTLSAPSAVATSNAGTTHAITLTGFSDNNYNLTGYTQGTLTINKRDITAAWNAPLSRAYGDANPGVTTANFTYSSLVNGDTNATVTASADYLGTTVLSNVGSYGVNGTFTSANYNITNTPSTTLTIGKRDITAAVNNQSRAYGDANPALTWADVVWTNLANAQDGSVIDALTLSAPSAVATSNAGTTHAITLTGFNDNNYNLTGYTQGTLTINKRDITAAVNNQSRAYGDSNPALGWADIVWTNLAGSETGAVIDALTLSSPTATALSDAGTTHTIGLTGFSDNNYNLTGFTNGTLTIGKRDITAAVNNQSRIYGDGNPALTWSDVVWTNLANAQDGSVIDALTLAAPSAVASSNAGTTHAITLTGFSDNNYNLTGYTQGTLTISKRDITADLGAHTQAYGEAGPVPDTGVIVWGNTLGGDSFAAMDSVTFTAPSLFPTSAAGSAHALDIGAFSDINYNLVSTTPGTITVTKAELTVTVDNAARRKGEPDPVFTFTAQGLKNNEDISVISGLSILSAADALSNPGSYALTASGGTALNYLITTYTNGILTVEAPPPVVSQTRNILPQTYEISLSSAAPASANIYVDLFANRRRGNFIPLGSSEDFETITPQAGPLSIGLPYLEAEPISPYLGYSYIFISEDLRPRFSF